MKNLIFAGMLCLLFQTSFTQELDSIRHYDLEEVSVSATKTNTRLRDIPQKVEIIDQSLINSLHADNFAELIKRTTNLDIVQYTGLSAKIAMRGFSPSSHSRSYTLLLIDGKPAGTVNLATINTSFIERVEVIKGPYSTLYGSDAMGGVINIITKAAHAKEQGSISMEGGSFGSLKVSGDVAASLGESTAFALGFSRQAQQKDYRIGSNNLLPLSAAEKLIMVEESHHDVMRNSSYQTNHFNAKIAHRIKEVWDLEALAFYSFSDDIETPGNYWGSYGTNKKDFTRLNLYGTLSRNTEKNSFNLSPYFTRENTFDYSSDTDSGFINFITITREYGFKLHDNIRLGGFYLLLGADMDWYDYQSERYSAKATPTNPYQPDYANTKSALYAQLSYKQEGWVMNAGLRYDLIHYAIAENELLNGSGGSDFYQALNPSIGAQYTFPFMLKLHGSLGRAYSVPDAFKVAGYYSVSEYFADWDFWWISYYEGNPELKPESSTSFDLGYSYSLKNKLLYLDMTYFHTNHKDKIVEYAIGYDSVSYRNANRSLMTGIELLASSNLGVLFDNALKLELYANFTINLKNNVDEALTDRAGNDSIVTHPMLYTRKASGNFGVYFDNYRGFSTRLNFRYCGARLEEDNFRLLRPGWNPEDYYVSNGYTVSDEIIRMPDFLIVDYSVFYTLDGNKRFGITISNLLDENYHEKDGYHMPGRMVSGNFTYSF